MSRSLGLFSAEQLVSAESTHQSPFAELLDYLLFTLCFFFVPFSTQFLYDVFWNIVFVQWPQILIFKRPFVTTNCKAANAKKNVQLSLAGSASWTATNAGSGQLTEVRGVYTEKKKKKRKNSDNHACISLYSLPWCLQLRKEHRVILITCVWLKISL